MFHRLRKRSGCPESETELTLITSTQQSVTPSVEDQNHLVPGDNISIQPNELDGFRHTEDADAARPHSTRLTGCPTPPESSSSILSSNDYMCGDEGLKGGRGGGYLDATGTSLVQSISSGTSPEPNSYSLSLNKIHRQPKQH